VETNTARQWLKWYYDTSADPSGLSNPSDPSGSRDPSGPSDLSDPSCFSSTD